MIQKLNKTHVLIFVIVLMWVGLLYFYIRASLENDIQIERLNDKIKNQKEILTRYENIYNKLDSTYQKEFKSIDSLQKVRDNIDQSDYDYDADSLQKLWSERFD